MDRQRPPEMDITAPNLTAFIFQEANRRHWYKRLSALSQELRQVDYKFARVSKGYPLMLDQSYVWPVQLLWQKS